MWQEKSSSVFAQVYSWIPLAVSISGLFPVSRKQDLIVANPQIIGSAFQDSNIPRTGESLVCGTKTPGALASELAKSAVKIRQVIES